MNSQAGQIGQLKALLPAFVLSIGIAGCAPVPDGGTEVSVSDVWSRVVGVPGGTGVVYATISNRGRKADTLESLHVRIATRVEIHESSMEAGVMRMRKIEHLRIPSNETIRLEPGGLHGMLIDVDRPVVVSDTFRVLFNFSGAGTVSTIAVVR